MKDGQSINVAGAVCQREMSESQAAVLDELQVKGENGVADMYRRGLATLKNRLIRDDEYDPAENLSLARVITMLEHDVAVLSGAVTADEEKD